MLKVEPLPRPNPPLNFPVFLLAVAGGFGAFMALMLLEDRGIAAGVAFASLLPFFYAAWKADRKKREARVCPQCQAPLPPPLETSAHDDGQPILHHCEKCEILWFAGSTRSS